MGDSIKLVVWPDFILMAWPQNSMILQFLVAWSLTLALSDSLEGLNNTSGVSLVTQW